MIQTAKLFMTGRSQAVRLPREFRFEGKEVFIRRNEQTGEVVLSSVAGTWSELFKAIDRHGPLPAEFMDDRAQPPVQERDVFGEDGS